MKNKYGDEFIPRRQTTRSVGYDIYAVEDMLIEPWGKTFDTGISFTGEECPEIEYENQGHYNKHEFYPDQWFAMIVPRSSMGFKHGLQMANTICIIDSDYRDTIKVKMKAEHRFTISKGERYAQMIFLPHCILLDEINPVNERSGGIGSTS
jgi:dUTP pyrophosphatase